MTGLFPEGAAGRTAFAWGALPERPAGGFGCVLADPPWRFENRSARGEARNPSRHYACVGAEALARLPVAGLAARDAWLAVWATSPLLDQAVRLIGAWGFGYVAFAPWIKTTQDGRPAFGTGYVFRSAVEVLLVGRRGRPALLTGARSQRNLVAWERVADEELALALTAPRREHSRKPDEQYLLCERLFPGPYLELFSRSARPGWTCWGDEAGRWDAGGRAR